MDSAAVDRLHRLILGLAVVITGLTAWFSSGYYAADEHYQVIAFAQQRLGESSVVELPWEYDARIRSAALPMVAYTVIRAARAVLHADPFLIAFLLRCLTAGAALFAVSAFVRVVLRTLDAPLRAAFVLLSYGLWFLPYQHVRFASETWAGLLLITALARLWHHATNPKSDLLVGLLAGACIVIRPAMILPWAGVFAWLVYERRMGRKDALRTAAGSLFALVVAILIDRWFYGDNSFTVGRYLHLAVAGDPAHVFEAYPFYAYPAWIMKYGIWPIGALILVAFVWVAMRLPRHWLVWCIAPALFGLSMLPHKELRFLFPFVDLVPLLLITAWGQLRTKATLVRWRPALNIALVALCAIDASALVVCACSPAGSGRTRLAQALRPIASQRSMTLSYALDAEGIWAIRIPRFYLPANVVDLGTMHGAGTTDLVIAPEGTAMTGYRAVACSEAPWNTCLMHWYNPERGSPFVLWLKEAAAPPR